MLNVRSEGEPSHAWTERTRKVFTMAREEAARLNHEYIGTEHLLLGLVREGEGVGAAALMSLEVDPENLMSKLSAGAKKKRTFHSVPLLLTSRSKKALELAMAEARELSHNYVGTEHLLMGLIREEKGIAALTLMELGITAEKARGEILKILGQNS